MSEEAKEAPEQPVKRKRGRPRKSVVDEAAAERIAKAVSSWGGKRKARKRAPKAEVSADEEFAPRGSAEAVLGVLVAAGIVTDEQVAAARLLAA